ncbi:sodium:proton antiporter [Weissella diestrammenae]|uniref:Sodium:proton antiporter n=1 Tax=Weissella diestrammenae TaxID=1162633 RepID=A0A7G9T7C9_9LACO|nr:sodium:proton antiporter [Weissella diestrammenae]MCM0582017.1 sodium:proton antiporter [Weissella diestrammenae]QNN76004.1 sodium:proton antiporter [Weissella diestrammenae]
MQTFYTLALLIIGVIVANIVKQIFPRIPEAFILIVMGMVLSVTPIFNHFELEPEFFMLMIIAPLMFIDGQKQSFQKIRDKFSVIFLLSVVLAAATVAVVGLITNFVESVWTLPLAIALAAIVTPTDAVAVKSLTSGGEMPSSVGEALELEALFNDATGLVILDLALSVLGNQSLSFVGGLEHFIFVALGGVIVGIVGGMLIVSLRVNLNLHATNAETTVIPIGLLTPFAIYLLAEQFGVSGILAVVATGIVHNWEASRLRLSSTRVQLTQNTIWSTLSNVLNSIVFLILGITLPTVFQEVQKIGRLGTLALVGVSILIYLVMFIIRYTWALREDGRHHAGFFTFQNQDEHNFYSRIFAISGVHGTMTLAMAFSLPHEIAGHAFPYRDELIIIAALVILISMVVSALVLPRMLPKSTTLYSDKDIEHVRNKMVDYAILQVRDTIDEHDIREALTAQLQSQKGWGTDREHISQDYEELLTETKEFIISYIHGDYVSATYSVDVINIYDKIIDRLKIKSAHLQHGPFKQFRKYQHHVKHLMRETKWHVKHGGVTPNQRRVQRDRWQKAQGEDMLKKWQDTHTALLALNDDVINAVDKHIDDILRERLDAKRSDNQHIDLVRKTLNRYLANIKHDYSKTAVTVDSELYMQAFQFEYNFIHQGVSNGYIPQAMATELYNEINQAQTLQLQQQQQLETMTVS